MNKSDMVRNNIKNGKWKEALRDAKGFRIGVSAAQRSAITRAYECIVHPGFYLSIGKNPAEEIENGKKVLAEVIGM